MPPIFIFMPAGLARAPADCGRASHAHQRDLVGCALMIRSRSAARLARAMVGAHFAITMAWAWWWIIPDMKWMSAAVYGYRALSARALALAASGPVAVRMAFERAPCAQAAKTTAARRRIWKSRRVRFTAGLELDMIGTGEYRTCTTFDSGDGVKVGYKLLTA